MSKHTYTRPSDSLAVPSSWICLRWRYSLYIFAFCLTGKIWGILLFPPFLKNPMFRKCQKFQSPKFHRFFFQTWHGKGLEDSGRLFCVLKHPLLHPYLWMMFSKPSNWSSHSVMTFFFNNPIDDWRWTIHMNHIHPILSWRENWKIHPRFQPCPPMSRIMVLPTMTFIFRVYNPYIGG